MFIFWLAEFAKKGHVVEKEKVTEGAVAVEPA